LKSLLREYHLYLSWFVSLVAVGGSLYFSEVLLMEPCKLCWFQRIFMYPLVILLGVAAYRNDKTVVRYTLPLSMIGFILAIVHYLIQKLPTNNQTFCIAGVACELEYINWFGFITLPFLSLISFLLIIGLQLFGIRSKTYNHL
jgi:disulfide bond formation protein DsbB